MSRTYKKINELIDEISMGPFGSDIKVEYFEKQGVPVLNGSNIAGVKLKDGFTNFVSHERAKGYKKAVAKRGDIVITHRGTLGQIAYVPDDSEYEEYVISQSQFRVSLKVELINPIYFAYYFHTNEGQKRLLSFKSHVGVPALAQATTNFRLLDFPVRPKREQDAIVNVLESIDKKIELNNRINAQLEAMAKTLYDYWFVQFDFPDDSPQGQSKPYKTAGGKMVYNPTLKREIPEGWEVKKLADVTSLIRRGISPKYTDEGGISVLNQKCVRNQKISFEDARRHKIELDDEDERLLKPFDVVVNSTGVGTLGRVAYVKRLPEKKTTVDSHVSIVRAKSELLSPLYLVWKLMRHQPVIESAANGSTGQVELSKSFLEDIDVIIPSDSIVKRFEEFVTPLVPELASRESENEQLVQLRDWLLPMLMNGQVTVK